MKVAIALPQHVGPVHWSALIASAEGFYAREGLDVELRWMDQDDQTKSLLSGATPIERRGPDEDLTLIEAGEPIRIIAGIVAKPPAYLYGARGVTALDQLRGTTLGGVATRFASSLALRMVLADAGLREGEHYTVRTVGGTERRFAALAEGSVSATLLTPPASVRAQRAGFPLLAALPERYPNFLYSSMQVNVGFADANSEVVVALLRAEILAQRFLANPFQKDASLRALVAGGDVGYDDAVLCYEEMVEGDDVFSREAHIGPESLADLIAGLRRLGDCECRLPPHRYLETKWLDLAREQLRVG